VQVGQLVILQAVHAREPPGLGRGGRRSLYLIVDDTYNRLLFDVLERIEVRLARLLCRLAPTKPASGWVSLQFSPTNPEMARTIGTTRWQISHYMHRFQQLGWLQRRPGLWIQRDSLTEFLESSGKRT